LQNCICDRPASHIVCTRCGFELVGRLQKVCPEHPKKLALMDHRECPNRLCKSIHLIEVSLQH
uniref:TRAF-type domain-containing protein n=1 Tax=Gongylonema pulchrum TaxID=637853 RepID=A0A183D9R4_9BILA